MLALPAGVAGVPLEIVFVSFFNGVALFLHDSFFVVSGEAVANQQTNHEAGAETDNAMEDDEGGEIGNVGEAHNLLFPEMASV